MPRQKITIDPEEKRIRQEEELSKKAPVQGKVRFALKGNGMTVVVPNTGGVHEITTETGATRKVREKAKKLDFNNGWAETSDPEIIEKIQTHRFWGKDFYFHPTSCPDDGDLELAKEFAMAQKEMIKEMKEREEKAKHFDKLAHPIEGVDDPINPETGKPDPVGAWPN